MKVLMIADSIWQGRRISTLACTYPRFIHAEVMTHRMFSRNASSSRAIPVAKLLALAELVPTHWGKNQKGMQAGAEVDSEVREKAIAVWKQACAAAVAGAVALSALGIHKQIVNRLLEPFTPITTLITATEWDNFFALRCHKDAEPHMNDLAMAIRDAMGARPTVRDWHMPFATASEGALVSAARCARVSYLNHDGTAPDTDKDLALAESLLSSRHMSPFEHQAYAMPGCVSGNFRHWRQYRKTIVCESGLKEI